MLSLRVVAGVNKLLTQALLPAYNIWISYHLVLTRPHYMKHPPLWATHLFKSNAMCFMLCLFFIYIIWLRVDYNGGSCLNLWWLKKPINLINLILYVAKIAQPFYLTYCVRLLSHLYTSHWALCRHCRDHDVHGYHLHEYTSVGRSLSQQFTETEFML